MNNIEKRALLDKTLGSGSFATIIYTKKTTGEKVKRTIKLWMERHLASGDRNIVGVNPVAASNSNIYPYSDIAKDGFRSFDLTLLEELHVGGKVYTF